MSKVGVGSIVESKCGKCNDVTGHVVMAMVGETIIKVECRACQSVHKYRPADAPLAPRGGATVKKGRNGVPQEVGRPAVPAAAPKASAARTARAPRSSQPQHLDKWRQVAARGTAAFTRAYAPTEQFSAEDLITHSVFGLGEVQELIAPDKMDVLFEEGVKRLLCNK